MAIKEFLNKADFTTRKEAMDLFGNAVRKSLNFTQYDTENTFEAIVLSAPIFLIDADLSSGRTAIGQEGAKMSKFGFKARIISDPSPHAWLPDPCDPTIAGNTIKATKIINMHTTFFSGDDYSRASSTLPKIGDIIFVELEDNVFSFNLQYGKFLSIKTVGGAEDQNLLGVGSECRSTMREFYAGPVITTTTAAPEAEETAEEASSILEALLGFL